MPSPQYRSTITFHEAGGRLLLCIRGPHYNSLSQEVRERWPQHGRRRWLRASLCHSFPLAERAAIEAWLERLPAYVVVAREGAP